MRTSNFILAAACLLLAACEPFNYDPSPEYREPADETLLDVARMIAELPLQQEQLDEVHQAVEASVGNGYDEEYLMSDLFSNPGEGVGHGSATKSPSFKVPLRDMIREHLSERFRTRAGETDETLVDGYIEGIIDGNAQIYWPYYENWDGGSLPVLTYDPENAASANVGYAIVQNADGEREIEEIIVDEEYARTHPVWVINRNDDSGYKSLEMKRKEDPEWGRGGNVVVKSGSEDQTGGSFQTLILKNFRMTRNFDSWFGGASEFFIKCGGVNGFKAQTEEEMRNYQPSVTDFMIVVRRSEVGKAVPFNAIVVSDWTDQMENYAFLITEDDGGTTTSWKCSATVKVKSKSYGFDIDIPYKDKDDIVWRGSLAREYIEKFSGRTEHFGDVDLMFEIRKSR